MKSKSEKWIGRMIIGLFIIMALALCIGVTASARGKALREERQKAYLEKKAVVVRTVREYLSERGYQNSGVTLTRREYGEDEEEYQLMIHHSRLEHLSDSEREELEDALAQFASGFGSDAVMLVTLN